MESRGQRLAVAIWLVLACAAVGGAVLTASLPRSWADWRRRVQGIGIHWSGDFLRSMGAVNSASRAEQEALLAHRVSSALADRFQDAGRDLSVLIIGGVIHLEGMVGNRDERTEAEEIARQVSGAQIVADDLRVASKRR